MNWIDYLLLTLIVFSCIAGLMRGLLREVIALVTWIAAIWIAWTYASLIESHLGGALANESVRPWVARALVFLVGRWFGLLRGLVMVGLFVILCHAVRLEGEPWWRQSLLVPYAEHAANVLRGMVGERKIHVQNSVSAAR